jgi:AcrR family transcriptional regulator
MTDETDLPADVVLLWGLNETPRRGPKPSLTVGDITRAAIEVADAEGLAAVSMARVAAHLGNATMALYRHVKSKDELLQLMADAAFEEPPELPESGDWREALTLWARELVTGFRRHPWCAQIPIAGPPVGPRNLAWFDRALDALSGTGLSEEIKVGVVMGLLTYVQGEIRLSLELAAAYAENPDAFSRQYGRALARVVDPRRMPALSRVIEAGVFDAESLYDADAGVDPGFELGLSLYLDGLAAFISRYGGS